MESGRILRSRKAKINKSTERKKSAKNVAKIVVDRIVFACTILPVSHVSTYRFGSFATASTIPDELYERPDLLEKLVPSPPDFLSHPRQAIDANLYSYSR